MRRAGSMIDLLLLIVCMISGIVITSYFLEGMRDSYALVVQEDKSMVSTMGNNTPPEFRMTKADVTMMLLIQDGSMASPEAIQINDNAIESLTSSWLLNSLSNTKRIYQTELYSTTDNFVDNFYLDYSGGTLRWRVIID